MASYDHEQVSYTSTGVLDQSYFALTAPGPLDLKEKMPSPNMYCVGFRSGLFYGHFRTLQRLESIFECTSGYCPAGRPVTSGGDAAF